SRCLSAESACFSMCLLLDGLVFFLVAKRLCPPFSHIILPQKQSMQSHKASTTQKPSALLQMNLKNFQKRLTKGSDVRRQDYTDVEVSIQKKRISSMSSLFDLKYPS